MMMMQSRLIGVGVLSLSLLGLASAPAVRADVMLTATLDGAQETPPTGVNGRATATFVFDDETNVLTYDIMITTPLTGAVVAAHIHVAPRGQAGDIKVPLDNSGHGTADLSSLAGLDDFLTKLFDGDTYVNLHTAAHPGGEIRGQIGLSPGQCNCKAARNLGQFRSCVAKAIGKLDKPEKKDDGIKDLKRAVKKATCGKKGGPKRAIACCLPQTPEQNIVVGHVCAALTETKCAKIGGTKGGDSCFSNKAPANPCRPQASPAAAFLEDQN
jgi:CHRD domain